LPPSAVRIRVGEGKIGWVAEAKVEMAADDWLNMTRTEGRTIEDNHASLRLDLLGPLVHHEDGKERLLGVLSVGAPALRPRDEKLMLQMVTNLASIAYTNSRNMRQMSDLANHDGLTGLLNKRYFMTQRLGLLINAAERDAGNLAVFIFDIDHFKKFNDTWGHQTGDQVLRLVANCIQENVKGRDTAARFGGEEFAVVLPQTELADAVRLAGQLRSRVESKRLVKKSNGDILGTITISIGVAQYDMKESIESLVQRADACLYAAKRNGRNRVTARPDEGQSKTKKASAA
jgi:diguanylate cyclase